MTQAGHAKFGRDKLLGRWDNPAPGAFDESFTGERVFDGRAQTCMYAYRRAKGCAPLTTFSFPKPDPPPRARPAMVWPSICLSVCVIRRRGKMWLSFGIGPISCR